MSEEIAESIRSEIDRLKKEGRGPRREEEAEKGQAAAKGENAEARPRGRQRRGMTHLWHFIASSPKRHYFRESWFSAVCPTV